MMRKRDEDAADKWLRENDPYYTGRGKTKEIQYPYLTPDQELRRQRKEIPLSCFRDDDLGTDDNMMDILNLKYN